MVADCQIQPLMIETADAPEEGSVPSRSQVMLQILELNPSATPSFLMRFDLAHLAEYLDHLSLGLSPRGKESVWVRRGLTRAICSCESVS